MIEDWLLMQTMLEGKILLLLEDWKFMVQQILIKPHTLLKMLKSVQLLSM